RASGRPIPVGVLIVAREGVRTLVGTVSFAGNQALDEAAMRALIGLQPGGPFVPAQLAADRDAVTLRYLNLGYEKVSVEVKPEISRDGTRADLLFTVRE